jgi:hypothetical protein
MLVNVKEFCASGLYKVFEAEALANIDKYTLYFSEILPLMFKYTNVENITEICTESRKSFEIAHRDVIDSISSNGII